MNLILPGVPENFFKDFITNLMSLMRQGKVPIRRKYFYWIRAKEFGGVRIKVNFTKEVFRLNTTVTTFSTIFYHKRDFHNSKQIFW